MYLSIGEKFKWSSNEPLSHEYICARQSYITHHAYRCLVYRDRAEQVSLFLGVVNGIVVAIFERRKESLVAILRQLVQ